jgi:type IV pilus assembly protein PilC
MSQSNSWLNKEITFTNARFKDEQKAVFYETLSTLINAGLELLKALEVAKEEQKKTALQKTLQRFIDQIIQGSTFAQCLASQEDFSSYEAYSVQIGEETGKIGFILTQLAHYFESRVKQRRQIISTLTYPIVILSFATLAIFFMVTYVVPMFANVFKRFGGELPAITSFIIKVSNGVSSHLFAIGICLGLLTLALKLLYSQPKFKRALHYTMLRVPVVGPLVRDSYTMRWCSAMYLMTSSNIPILRGLEITAQMLQFYPLQDALLSASQKVERGAALHEVMGNYTIFTKRLISLVAMGEEVNKLDRMFLNLSNNLEKEVDHKSKQLSTILEPIIILLLGGVVAFILVAMYLPMFKLGDGIG